MRGIGDFLKMSSVNNTLANRLNNWKIKADEFYRSSEYLWIEINKDHLEMINRREKGKEIKKRNYISYTPSIAHPYFLLISLSIENLLKGIILYLNPNLITGKLNKSVKTHDLKRISNLTTIQFSKDENDFLNMASTLIPWYSRYPIPTNTSEVIQSANFDYNKIRNIKCLEGFWFIIVFCPSGVFISISNKQIIQMVPEMKPRCLRSLQD